MDKGRCSDASAQDTGQPGCGDLIARLEQASEGSRELDALIYIYRAGWKSATAVNICGADYPGSGQWGRWSILRPTTPPHVVLIREFPDYTTSLDAALTLLPANHSYELIQSGVEPPALSRARLWDWRRSPLMSDPRNEWKAEGNRPLPVNVCIACLKARADLATATAPGNTSAASNTEQELRQKRNPE